MGNFTVGTAKLDITPGLGCHMCGYFEDRIATGINDPLYVKALAISDGEREIGLITLDIIDISRSVVEKAKELITAKTGVDAEHILISTTHTHTGPAVMSALGTPAEPGYADSLIPRIADAFIMAHNAKVPAEIAHASGDVHEEVHNRRWYMKDGSTRMNPGYMNPNAIRPAGPTDPQLGLLIARDPVTKKPLALYANLALHYVGPSKIHTIISADYFGCFAAAMQRIAGADYLVMLANGTQGNINNCDFTKPGRTSRTVWQQCERVANVCAGEAWKAWNLLRDEDFKTEGFVDAKISMIPFDARTPSAELLEESKKVLGRSRLCQRNRAVERHAVASCHSSSYVVRQRLGHRRPPRRSVRGNRSGHEGTVAVPADDGRRPRQRDGRLHRDGQGVGRRQLRDASLPPRPFAEGNRQAVGGHGRRGPRRTAEETAVN